MTRAAILFSALVLLVLLSRWVADLISPPTVVQVPSRHTPDFYLTEVEAWAMDPEGALQHRMRADRVTHFGDDDSVELERPRFLSLDGDQPRWSITAESALSDAAGEVVRLRGEVTLVRQGDAKGRLETRDLLLKPREDYAETGATVRFTDAHSVVTAVGLRGYLGEGGHLELLSTVRGRHEPN